jgi:hypothetical protein
LLRISEPWEEERWGIDVKVVIRKEFWWRRRKRRNAHYREFLLGEDERGKSDFFSTPNDPVRPTTHP